MAALFDGRGGREIKCLHHDNGLHLWRYIACEFSKTYRGLHRCRFPKIFYFSTVKLTDIFSWNFCWFISSYGDYSVKISNNSKYQLLFFCEKIKSLCKFRNTAIEICVFALTAIWFDCLLDITCSEYSLQSQLYDLYSRL